jgi:hypothetical protein
MVPLLAPRSIGIAFLLPPPLGSPSSSIGRSTTLQSSQTEPHRRCALPDVSSGYWQAANDDIAVGMAHLLAGELMDLAGPLFWAVLAVGLISDILGIPLPR